MLKELGSLEPPWSRPLKGVEARYAYWLMGLTIRAVDYESLRLSHPFAIRHLASALWLEAQGFVHEPLGH